MKRKRHREEQIISILKEHEAGATVRDLSRRHAVEHGQVVAERLTRRRRCRDDGVAIFTRRFPRAKLVRVELLDSARSQDRRNAGVYFGRKVDQTRRRCGNHSFGRDPRAVFLLEESHEGAERCSGWSIVVDVGRQTQALLDVHV